MWTARVKSLSCFSRAYEGSFPESTRWTTCSSVSFDASVGTGSECDCFKGARPESTLPIQCYFN